MGAIKIETAKTSFPSGWVDPPDWSDFQNRNIHLHFFNSVTHSLIIHFQKKCEPNPLIDPLTANVCHDAMISCIALQLRAVF